jgi:AbrB family looped-hinge helix DNA binding protein
MAIANSRVTAQGQISVPSEVRRKLGVGPGSVLEWDEVAGQVILRRAGRYSSEDVHRALFPKGPPKARTAAEMKSGIQNHVRARHARR